LTNQLTKHSGLLENLSISIDRWLVPITPEPSSASKKRMNLPHQLSAPYIKNNSTYLIFVTLFLLFNLFLFITRGLKFWIKTRSLLVVFARACGKKIIYFLIHLQLDFKYVFHRSMFEL
jgi:NADPH oxidase 5